MSISVLTYNRFAIVYTSTTNGIKCYNSVC